jgi:O-antigen ligase
LFGFLAIVSRPGASLRLILPMGVASLALVSVLAGSARVREAVLSRFSTFDNLELDKSYMLRQALNQKSWRLFEESPLCGIGPGRFMAIYVPLDLPKVFTRNDDAFINTKSSHNSYFSFLAEGGLVATVPLALLLIILAVRGALAAVVLNRRGEHWALGIYGSFIAMSMHFWVLAGLTGTHPWFVYGLLAATVVLAARVREQSSVRVARPPAVHRRPALASRRPVVVDSQ